MFMDISMNNTDPRYTMCSMTILASQLLHRQQKGFRAFYFEDRISTLLELEGRLINGTGKVSEALASGCNSELLQCMQPFAATNSLFSQTKSLKALPPKKSSNTFG